MSRWAWHSIQPCFQVIGELFWCEATWGLTYGLRQLRVIRLYSLLMAFMSAGLVLWGIAIYHKDVLAFNRNSGASYSDSYSYYEGKVLEERMNENRKRIDTQELAIKQILSDSNTQTLLAVRMQGQIEQMQKLLDVGIKVLGGVVCAVVAGLLRDLVQFRLRTERTKIGNRRSTD